MDQLPFISIISPVYNAEPYVETCVMSCLKQSLKSIELVFVDDGSTDGSLAVLKGIEATCSNLRVFSQCNKGASAARNRGLEAARGKYIFFIDADDYIPNETALERLYVAAERQNVLIAGGSMCIDRDGVIDANSLHGSVLDSFSREEVLEYQDYQYDYDFTRYIYNREFLNEKGIRFPELSQFEDPLFFVEAMMAAGRFAAVPVFVYAYRYGHQEHQWSEKGLLDRLNGMSRLLELSREKELAILHWHVTRQLDVEITQPILDHVGNAKIMLALCRAQALVDSTLVRSVDSQFPLDYVIEPLRLLTNEYLRLQNLKGSSLGRMILRVVSK